MSALWSDKHKIRAEDIVYADDDVSNLPLYSHDDNYAENGTLDDGMREPAPVIHEVVKNFLEQFNRAVCEQNIVEIHNCYEVGFNTITEQFYKNSPWPDPRFVEPWLDDKSSIFIILYKELYYRHIHAKLSGGPTLAQRIDSFSNYCLLFNSILNVETPITLELPQQWLWDMIDEFIYQFQAFTQFRSRTGKWKNLSEDDIATLSQHLNIWNIHSIINVLYSLVAKSNINRQLEAMNDENEDFVTDEFGKDPLYKMMGYFSLIGLLRLHTLLGDYYQGLKCIENVDLNKLHVFSGVPACHITTFYYVGFCYMMLQRYEDAIRTFSNILLYMQKSALLSQTKQVLYDSVTKLNDQMYVLLSLCLSLYPTRIDENVYQSMIERTGDKRMKLLKGDVSEIENCFRFACPKFISPVIPSFVGEDASMSTAFDTQVDLFMYDVVCQKNIATVRSYLKLYTTLPIWKLANFMDMPEDKLIHNLICFKHKTHTKVWNEADGKNPLGGQFKSGSDVNFYIDGDMIHIADTKVSRCHGDFFVRQIQKLQEINKTLKTASNAHLAS